ncbi:MAG TPA: group III truncated hemoglobin, partial [Bacteroidia bacterium]|nr:group III truncated hemoglobin [Bacteroidia bacterium]
MGTKTNADISCRADIELLISSFYQKVLKDPLLKPQFEGLDIVAHLPVMYDFWSSLLLNEHAYTGNAFDKHLRLQLSVAHFKHWLQLFEETLDELFAGEKTELAR